jgi:hypothetical protein
VTSLTIVGGFSYTAPAANPNDENSIFGDLDETTPQQKPPNASSPATP